MSGSALPVTLSLLSRPPAAWLPGSRVDPSLIGAGYLALPASRLAGWRTVRSAMLDGYSDNDLWAAMLDIQLAWPTLSPTVRRALGEELQDRYEPALGDATPEHIAELLHRLTALGGTDASSTS